MILFFNCRVKALTRLTEVGFQEHTHTHTHGFKGFCTLQNASASQIISLPPSLPEFYFDHLGSLAPFNIYVQTPAY